MDKKTIEENLALQESVKLELMRKLAEVRAKSERLMWKLEAMQELLAEIESQQRKA